MKTVKRNYELPEKIVRNLQDFSVAPGISMQKIVAAGAAVLMEMAPSDRDKIIERFGQWLKEGHPAIAPDLVLADASGLMESAAFREADPLTGMKDIVDALVIDAESFTVSKWDRLFAALDKRRGLRPCPFSREADGKNPGDHDGVAPATDGNKILSRAKVAGKPRQLKKGTA